MTTVPPALEPPPALDPTVFHKDRPTDLRKAAPWHRFAYLIRKLPEAIRELAQDLDMKQGERLLDYGCAELPYRAFFRPDIDFVGADLPGNPHASLEIKPDGTVAAPDGTFDVVLSTQVLEHVSDPRVYVSECFRLLRPGGQLLLTTHGIFFYHPDPVDYWRWTCAGLRREVELAGFEVERFEGVVGLTATGLHLVNDSLYYQVPRVLRPLFALFLQSLIALADRFDGRANRRLNALVFGLIARKPLVSGPSASSIL
jgi:SAM-dependent methyltransferase